MHWKSKAAIDVDDANGQNAKPWDFQFDNKGLTSSPMSAGPKKGAQSSDR
jgi:hypothetical protein